MKIRTLGAIALIASLSFAVSCQKEDKSWKNIPYDKVEVASGAVKATVNDVAVTGGTVQITAVSNTEGQIVMENFIPGYASVSAPATLKKVDDTSFDFSCSTSLTHPSVVLPRSSEVQGVYDLYVNGNITTEGKITLEAEIKVKNAALVGTWTLKRNTGLAENGKTPLAGPLELKWTVADEAQNKKLANVSALANMWGGMIVADALNKVTFLENGNITAEYFTPEKLGMWSPKVDKETKTAYYSTTTHATDGSNDWISSPAANYAFWYIGPDGLYVVPNAAEIAASQGEPISFDLSKLAHLADYGVNVIELAAIAAGIINEGVDLKYTLTEGTLDIYLDKESLDPLVKALLADPTKLDAVVDELKKGDNGMYITMGFSLLGISKVSDLLPLWNSTTTFELILHLEK